MSPSATEIMELNTINKLFLELSQFTTAKTRREIELEENYTRCINLLEKIHNEFSFSDSKLNNEVWLELVKYKPGDYQTY